MRSTKQIQAEIEKLMSELDAARARERSELEAKFHKMAEEVGLTVADVLGRSIGRGNGKSRRGGVPVKYRSKLGDTWSGRGRRPAWASVLGKADLEKLRVDV